MEFLFELGYGWRRIYLVCPVWCFSARRNVGVFQFEHEKAFGIQDPLEKYLLAMDTVEGIVDEVVETKDGLAEENYLEGGQ